MVRLAQVILAAGLLLMSGCAEVVSVQVALRGRPLTCEVNEVRPSWRSNVVLAGPCWDKDGNPITPNAVAGTSGADILKAAAEAGAVAGGTYAIIKNVPTIKTQDQIQIVPPGK